jgi:peptide/nickel transport system substrate-binding protein
VVRSRRSRLATAVAAIAALAVVASACGSSSNNSSNNNNNGGPETTAGIHDDSAGGTPVPGGSLVYGLEADTSGGFCLYKAQLAIAGIQVARTIYDTLTMPGADGKIHPYLAQSVTGSSNNTIWTIKLRPNIKFHDGSPLTAEVVKENLDHYQKDNPLFSFVFKEVKAIDVVGPLSVRVTTTVPWSAFPWFLWSSSRLGIMAKAQMDSPDCNTKLIGTGPFKFVSWKFGDKFVAKKNPSYWYHDPKTGAQLPYLDQITYVPSPDGSKRTTSLEAGDFTVIHQSDALEIKNHIRPDVASGKLKDTESDVFPELGYIMLNVTKPPFNNLAARQAFAYGVDRDTYNKIRNGGILQNASGPFGPGVDANLADTGLPKFDPAKAKQAAATYKQQTGKDLTFALDYDASSQSVKDDAILVQQMLQQNVGIKVQINGIADQSTLINVAIGRQYDATLWRNHPGADDDTQYVWWHCANSGALNSNPNGAPACDNLVNFGGFNDPVINSDLDKARSMPLGDARTKVYEAINRRFASQLWNLWAQYTLWAVAYQPSVHGILGPALPDGAPAFEGLPTGHPVDGMWCDGGKC